MLWHTSIHAAQQRWQAAVTNGQESGQAPQIELGQAHTSLEHLWALHALRVWQDGRLDVTAPEIAFGGEGALWLYLFIKRRAGNAPQVLEPLFIFTGVERSTQMACRISFVAPGFSDPLWGEAVPTRGLAAGAIPFVTPALEPAQRTNWESLPFVVQPVVQHQPFVLSPTGVTRWVAWAALFMAALLLLSPLFWG